MRETNHKNTFALQDLTKIWINQNLDHLDPSDNLCAMNFREEENVSSSACTYSENL